MEALAILVAAELCQDKRQLPYCGRIAQATEDSWLFSLLPVCMSSPHATNGGLVEKNTHTLLTSTLLSKPSNRSGRSNYG